MSRLKTPCSTPGSHYTIATHDRGFTVSVEMPDGVDLSSLRQDDLTAFHETIHRYAEDLAWQMIKQSQVRRGDFALGPHLRDDPPFATQTNDDSNAMEIIRRSAARLAAQDPTLVDDATEQLRLARDRNVKLDAALIDLRARYDRLLADYKGQRASFYDRTTRQGVEAELEDLMRPVPRASA
ncbi:hypothetical protein MARCHEWKA_01740 [Brevundimonas phage vB_BpoS-Marchewka]|uniref:Uncharacterized protein n=1 Tax=Brevundimonas phage vB_BpoS-Marchewka TaxID=2948604 RepID=A0A9E7STT1_9CAUD|nr:hypothetical protein MARCHEWKA_01740 [Brevundimonas phage vB_BpoS-Marchewka]UTC29133.1 hypothetical protein BAMBUS_00500 [Brevundimonas phage vB_BpoS-Bambus]